MSDEKRDVERVPVPGDVTGEITVFQPMTILDISERGAQIETAFSLHLEALHDLRLSLGQRSVVLKARIVYCKIGEIREGTVLYRAGVEFIEPSEHARIALTAFVDAQKGAARAAPTIVDAEIAED
jgi:hypothetical protein